MTFGQLSERSQAHRTQQCMYIEGTDAVEGHSLTLRLVALHFNLHVFFFLSPLVSSVGPSILNVANVSM